MGKINKKYKANIYRDSWAIDVAFYAWLLPRLKAFRDYTNGWPDQLYNTFEDFIADIDEKIKWLEFLYKATCNRKDIKITKEEIDSLFNEEMNDKYYEGDWRQWLNSKPLHMKCGDFEKIYDKDESDYIWKQEILTNVLGKAFGEWFGKNYSTLWW